VRCGLDDTVDWRNCRVQLQRDVFDKLPEHYAAVLYVQLLPHWLLLD
jgi:hypothetical protein